MSGLLKFYSSGSSDFKGLKSKEIELMQYRNPVGAGPSGNTCPRWLPQLLHITSVRSIPWL